MDILTMKTLKVEEDDDDNQSAKKTRISFPDEIIQDILSRLPVKPILQFRSVSKQWLSLISDDPSFPKLHLNRSHRTALLFSAYDSATGERHFLSAPHDGGPVTHLITFHNAQNYNAHYGDTTETEHLNGLVFFTSRSAPLYQNFAFVVNPATRKLFKFLPPSDHEYPNYFFGFDESNNEHKILCVCYSRNPQTVRFKIFSLSTYSWRQIPVNLEELSPSFDMIRSVIHGVCVNSVIHLMLKSKIKIEVKILAFDLTTEKFSIINLPQGAIPRNRCTFISRQGKDTYKSNLPFLIRDEELLGVVCHDLLVETNEMHIWILQDYVNRVWVRETVMVPESSEYWNGLDGMHIISYLDMGNLVSSCRRLSRDMVNVFLLDLKTKSFKSVNFNLGYRFLHSETVKFRQVRSYVESILPLREE